MNPIRVMVNGLPGNMAATVARHIATDSRFELVPRSLTGPEITDAECMVEKTAVELFLPDRREAAMEGVGALICIDYTHPGAVNANAEFYCRRGLPFVMGTTGGDREKLSSAVRSSAVSAVIAPNMAKQIVGFQAMMEYAADNFPGLFSGYRLEIRESHQHGKADTSGTAKAMVGYFNRLGIDFSLEQIFKERNPEIQRREWNIPEAYLSGHGWHTYSLVSGDDTVTFSFTHNVNGREVYARGTLDAVVFLEAKLRAGEKGKVYSMIDVLKGK